MIKATSPAAKCSPMQTDAMSASETSTSALMSKAVTRPIKASRMMGTPHSTMATHAASKGSCAKSNKLTTSATPEMHRNSTSFFMPPSSSRLSSFFANVFIPLSLPSRWLFQHHYTYRGIGCQAAHTLPGLIFSGKLTAAQKKSTAQKSHALFILAQQLSPYWQSVPRPW